VDAAGLADRLEEMAADLERQALTLRALAGETRRGAAAVRPPAAPVVADPGPMASSVAAPSPVVAPGLVTAPAAAPEPSPAALAPPAMAQAADTVRAGQAETYRVRGQAAGSLLRWEALGGSVLGENPTRADSVAVAWDRAGLGSLSVREEGAGGCLGQAHAIEVLILEPEDPAPRLEVPNVFTPNGDGANDLFLVWHDRPPDAFGLAVFNRWGQAVFETGDIARGWDGTWLGRPCAEGVYSYVVRFGSGTQGGALAGFVHLAR